VEQNSKSGPDGAGGVSYRLRWLPIPIILATMAVLRVGDWGASYESPYVWMVLNFLFSTLASMFIAYLIARSFVVRGTPELLMLACGVFVWGAAGCVGAAAPADANIQITIHNTGVWLSALCYLVGAVLSWRPQPAMRTAGLWLAAAYTLALGILGLVALSAVGHWTPTFFIQGRGGTPLRHLVLLSATAMIGFAAALLGAARGPLPLFTRWFALALALIATGLLGGMIHPTYGSLLGWTARAAQSLGSVYMVVAAIVSVRESRVWGLQLEAALRESEERFRIMADGSPIIIWVTDARGDVQFVNRTYREFFGVTCEHVQGRKWQPLIHPDDAGAYMEEFLQAVRERRLFKAEARARRADGEWRWIASHAEPRWSRTGEFLGHIGASPDITERKQAEAALRELNATLESKVAQRTRELQHRAGQLEKLTLELSQTEDRERRRIAAILHEDLQQQITGARFHLTLLKRRARRSPAQQTMVDHIDDMLREAVEKSRSLSHDLSPAVLHMNDLTEVLCWLAHHVWEKHGLAVHVHVLGEATLQSEALAIFLFRAAQEMLFNVVKHAQVQEAGIRARRMGRCMGLSVSDRGRGFDPRDLRETPGLGLFSIRERVELLGGRMKIRSSKGRGTTFHIVVPDGGRPREQARYA
jgi:PAS domain S-box-containing protein